MKIHHRIPSLVRQLCWLYDSWIVGSAVDYVLGKNLSQPKDFDVVVNHKNWASACKLVKEGSPANRFGGFKVNTENFLVDVWMDDIAELMSKGQCCSGAPTKRYGFNYKN